MDFSSAYLSFRREGAIGVLALTRPEKRNAISDRALEDLRRLFATSLDGARAVVVHGMGDHFCAGLDLAEHEERTPFESLQASRAWHGVFDMMQFGTVPLVAALTGAVIGGGMELAMTTHVRVAEPSTFYCLPEGRRGIFVGGSATVRVGRIVGPGRMTEMMLTGRRVDAEEGQRLGLSHYLVGEGESLAKAMELADTIAGNAPLSNYMILNAIARIGDMAAADGLFAESLAAAMTQTSGDHRTGIKAFLEKRDIRFDEREAGGKSGG